MLTLVLLLVSPMDVGAFVGDYRALQYLDEGPFVVEYEAFPSQHITSLPFLEVTEYRSEPRWLRAFFGIRRVEYTGTGQQAEWRFGDKWPRLKRAFPTVFVDGCSTLHMLAADESVSPLVTHLQVSFLQDHWALEDAEVHRAAMCFREFPHLKELELVAWPSLDVEDAHHIAAAKSLVGCRFYACGGWIEAKTAAALQQSGIRHILFDSCGIEERAPSTFAHGQLTAYFSRCLILGGVKGGRESYPETPCTDSSGSLRFAIAALPTAWNSENYETHLSVLRTLVAKVCNFVGKCRQMGREAWFIGVHEAPGSTVER